MKYTLKECPFCGHQPSEENLYCSIRRIRLSNEMHESQMRHTGKSHDLYEAGCVDHEGGCNAYVLGDSREDVIEKWNKRV